MGLVNRVAFNHVVIGLLKFIVRILKVSPLLHHIFLAVRVTVCDFCLESNIIFFVWYDSETKDWLFLLVASVRALQHHGSTRTDRVRYLADVEAALPLDRFLLNFITAINWFSLEETAGLFEANAFIRCALTVALWVIVIAFLPLKTDVREVVHRFIEYWLLLELIQWHLFKVVHLPLRGFADAQIVILAVLLYGLLGWVTFNGGHRSLDLFFFIQVH